MMTLLSPLPVPLIAAAGQRQVLDIRAQREIDARLDRVGPLAGRFRDLIAEIVDDVGVVAVAAEQAVGAAGAVQGIGGGVAGDDVAQPIAGAADRRAGQRQVLDIGAEREIDARLDDIGATAAGLADLVAEVVDDIGVVAAAARQAVRAGSAIQRVGAGIAGDDVVEPVAGAADRRAGQRQVLDIGAEGEVDARLDRVDALAGRLGHLVAEIVDDIGIVAVTAGQAIRADGTIQRIGDGVADNDVVEPVAGAADRRTSQRQVLDVSAQGEVDARLDRVGALAGQFGDLVAEIVDDVGVVAVAAEEAVRAGAAVQRIGAGVAVDDVIEFVAGTADRRAGQRQVLDIGAQREVDARQDRVGSAAAGLADIVAKIVDDIGIVAAAARQAVSASCAIQRVGAGIAGDDVVEPVARAADRRAGQRQVLDIGAQREADAR